MFCVTKMIEFAAAHRLFGYDGDCAHIHGHNYVLYVTIKRLDAGVNSEGFVCDFKGIKKIVQEKILRFFDHAVILYSEDKRMIEAMESMNENVMVISCNPTAENMAQLIYNKLNAHIEEAPYAVTNVKLYETSTSYAEYKA